MEGERHSFVSLEFRTLLVTLQFPIFLRQLLQADGISSLNFRHPGGEKSGGHPAVGVLGAGNSCLAVSAHTSHTNLCSANYVGARGRVTWLAARMVAGLGFGAGKGTTVRREARASVTDLDAVVVPAT